MLRLTRAGKAAFFNWLQNPQARKGPAKYDSFLRDPFLTRLFLAHHLGRAGERELILRHIQDIESRLRDITRLREGGQLHSRMPPREWKS